MPRYFFDVDDGHNVTRDVEGMEFNDRAAMRYAAIDALPEIAQDELPDGDHHVMAVLVRDELDRPIFQAKLTLDASWLMGASDV